MGQFSLGREDHKFDEWGTIEGREKVRRFLLNRNPGGTFKQEVTTNARHLRTG